MLLEWRSIARLTQGQETGKKEVEYIQEMIMIGRAPSPSSSYADTSPYPYWQNLTETDSQAEIGL